MSSGAGSDTSASRCNKMPTWRWSRTACCAAAIDFGRPSVIGSTRPGNKTVLRTGTMMSASGGKGGNVVAPDPAWFDDNISASATMRPRFLQGNHQTSIDDRAAYAAITAGRQSQPPVEAALRQFEAMNDGGAERGRIGARSGNHQFAVFNDGFDAFRIDARQRDQRQDFKFGFENIDRRLPSRLTCLAADRLEQIAMHPLRASEHLERFRPHPIAGHIPGHQTPPI